MMDEYINNLLEKWPAAFDIQAAFCHCDRQEVMLSFRLPAAPGEKPGAPGYEHCGFWCTHCNFSSAGLRQDGSSAK